VCLLGARQVGKTKQIIMRTPFIARLSVSLPLILGCSANGGETVDRTGDMPTEPVSPETGGSSHGGGPSGTATGAEPTMGGIAGAVPDDSGSAGMAAATGGAGGSAQGGAPAVPIETVEPLVTCEVGSFYCNGACLSEVGEQVGTCRMVYADPSPFAVLARFLVHDGSLLIPHDWGVSSVNLSDLSAQRLAEGFESVRYIQEDGELLYIAGAREDGTSLWTVPLTGGEPTSVGLDGNEIEWFHIYRGVLYHRVSVTREVKTMHMLDLASGVVTDIPTAANTVVPVSDFAFFPFANTLWRSPLSQIDNEVQVAETEGRIGSVYGVEEAVYYTSDETPQSILWRLDVAATEPQRIGALPSARSAGAHEPFGGDFLIEACPTVDSTQTYGTIPLEGGELTKVTELDACNSDTTRMSVDSALAAEHAYHAQEAADGGTHLVSAIIEVERP
jgi:hypothetical protein